MHKYKFCLKKTKNGFYLVGSLNYTILGILTSPLRNSLGLKSRIYCPVEFSLHIENSNHTYSLLIISYKLKNFSFGIELNNHKERKSFKELFCHDCFSVFEEGIPGNWTWTLQSKNTKKPEAFKKKRYQIDFFPSKIKVK